MLLDFPKYFTRLFYLHSTAKLEMEASEKYIIYMVKYQHLVANTGTSWDTHYTLRRETLYKITHPWDHTLGKSEFTSFSSAGSENLDQYEMLCLHSKTHNTAVTKSSCSVFL